MWRPTKRGKLLALAVGGEPRRRSVPTDLRVGMRNPQGIRLPSWTEPYGRSDIRNARKQHSMCLDNAMLIRNDSDQQASYFQSATYDRMTVKCVKLSQSTAEAIYTGTGVGND
jgi:hypothetical protein